MKKALIFSPYWDTGGGGEKYVSQAVCAYTASNYLVDILWNDGRLLSKIEDRYGTKMKSCKVTKELYKRFVGGTALDRYSLTKDYDSFFYVSDGTLPFAGSKQVLVHFQVPFHGVGGKRPINTLKKYVSQPVFVVNSQFTKGVIDDEFGVDSDIVYPPATMIDNSSPKEKIILSVGRFDNLMQSKRQDVLIDAFCELNPPSDWKLVLAGGLLHKKAHIDELRKRAKGKNIQILTNVSWDVIRSLYSKAYLYWHAAGYGQDENIHPEKMEHFGISIVEAMSAGAVPVVFSGGGPKEIVNNKNGFLWSSVDELVEHTQSIIADKEGWTALSKQATSDASHYSAERFLDAFKKIIS